MMSQSSGQANGGMTPEKYQELVRQVAEKVWRMLRDELRFANERRSKRDRRA